MEEEKVMRLKNCFMLVLCMMFLSNTCYAYQNINVNTMWEQFNKAIHYINNKVNDNRVQFEGLHISTTTDKDLLMEYNAIRSYPNALQATHCYSSNYVDKSTNVVRPFNNDVWLLCNENNDVRQLIYHIGYFSETESYKDGYILKYRRNPKPYIWAAQALMCMLCCFGEDDKTTLDQVSPYCAEALKNNSDIIGTITSKNGEKYICAIHKGITALGMPTMTVSISMPPDV